VEVRVREMAARLEKLRSAPILDKYNGPVLFTGQAAAELFSQVIGPDLLASRHPVADNPQFEMFTSRMENPFQDKLGGRVLPDFMTVTDDPTLSRYQGQPLLGATSVDDDGVRTRRTVLVENGVLKALLATRNPVPGVTESTGSRRGAASAPSNVLVTVDKGLAEEAMKAKLLGIVKQRGKPFGFVVERLANPLAAEPQEMMMSLMSSFMPGGGGEGAGTKLALVAHKIFPDGHEELVRNVTIDGLGPAAFKDIVAASSSSMVYNTPFVSMGSSVFFIIGGGSPGEVGAPLTSFVVPSMLFDDVTLKHPAREIPKPPLSPRPVGK
jgi:microcin-processing metallopeptidase PmbA/TldD-like protein